MKLTIVRGLPGSGKSTRAREIADQTGAILLEPDALLVEDGVYQYSPCRYSDACRKLAFTIEMLTHSGRVTPDIIYADVLPAAEDINSVIRRVGVSLGRENIKLYSLHVSEEESRRRNVHNVRHEDIARMASQWQEVCIDPKGVAVPCQA